MDDSQSCRAPDEYQLRIENRPGRNLSRKETFTFKRTQGRGRRITITGEKAVLSNIGPDQVEVPQRSIGLRRLSSGLSTLPRLSDTGTSIRRRGRTARGLGSDMMSGSAAPIT
ncbi:hypothetical protein PA7_11350 [Pseudonocardia asaccharolytica DSM 44247 = NBRC 16224]|uniref:Uncharacterized protein n=1 Tax=Pseudonocardia asaccharolytica DSM 44247 = NBRC 16224 TaxID=1123024 RepID=A0A511D319_9PSEU|nr:hypothetical protein PA7_11350 [Pseudonocardia asaccharolytica DSM 44247 = NBRC 16224]